MSSTCSRLARTSTLLSLLACSRAPAADREVFHLRAFEAPFGYAQAVRVGDVIHVSGSVSVDSLGNTVAPNDMKEQLRAAYGNVRATLDHFGVGFEDVVEERIYTTDMDALLEAAPIRAEFYRGQQWPVATWLGVNRLVDPAYLVEIEVTAVRPPSRRH